MKKIRGEEIREFILKNISQTPTTIAKLTADTFGITRQAVNKHFKVLLAANLILQEGQTRNCIYKLNPIWDKFIKTQKKEYLLSEKLAEDIVWQQDALPLLQVLPKNVLNICHYGFTEMFNNAIDHSEGAHIYVEIYESAKTIEISIRDDGVGIFKKIKKAMNLLDESHALFELSKGKLTTDRKRHTGEGIFFTSRAFDAFEILSGELNFSRKSNEDYDFLWDKHYSMQDQHGTLIKMIINKNSLTDFSKIFLDYGPEQDDYQFSKTVIPVKLAQYGNDLLISRSQAKRILARVELFKTVVLDFEGVENIGQAFADEIFRVFRLEHPDIKLIPIRYNTMVNKMILRAESVRL